MRTSVLTRRIFNLLSGKLWITISGNAGQSRQFRKKPKIVNYVYLGYLVSIIWSKVELLKCMKPMINSRMRCLIFLTSLDMFQDMSVPVIFRLLKGNLHTASMLAYIYTMNQPSAELELTFIMGSRDYGEWGVRRKGMKNQWNSDELQNVLKRWNIQSKSTRIGNWALTPWIWMDMEISMFYPDYF